MTASSYKPTQRFSDRVADYVRYRPGYPDEVVAEIVRVTGLEPACSRVADVGAGTGIFTQRLLAAGFAVQAVEPNAPMREAMQEWLGSSHRLDVLGGSAEATGLADASVDLLTAAQAFHWFDVAPTRREFERVLKAPGWVALVWNVRRTDGAFEADYERLLLEHCPDYAAGVPEQGDPRAIRQLFSPVAAREWSTPNVQAFDAQGLRGRLLSSSYTPPAGSAGRERLLAATDACFARHAREGRVEFRYDVRLFTGTLAASSGTRASR